MDSQAYFRKPILFLGTVVAASTLLGIIVFYTNQNSSQKVEESKIVEVGSSPDKITALGRLEPQTEVISLSAPVNLDGDRRTSIFE